MKHSGRNIKTPKIVGMVTNQCVGAILSEEHDKRRRDAENSPEKKLQRSGRELAQDYDVIKTRIMSDFRQATNQTAKDILQFIKEELGVANIARRINGYQQSGITSEQIEEIIIKCLPVLKELRRLSKKEEINSVNVNYFTNYELLFVELINLDTRFALYAPLQSLKSSKISEKLDFTAQEHQEKVNLLIAKLEENKHSDYVSTAKLDKHELDDERDKKIQSMVDFIREEEFKSKYQLVGATETLSSNIYSFIIKQLDMQEFDEKTIKYTDIKNVFSLCAVALNVLKDASSRKDLNEVSGWDACDPHTELFNNLMHLNMKFAFFAPKKSLNRLDIDFKRLSDKERNVMLKVLIDHGLWDDDEFYENYRRVFENGHNIGNGI